MISAATFRVDFAEFANAAAYPDSAINFWIAAAGLMLPVQTFGAGSQAAVSPPTTIMDIVTELFVAHNITLEMRAVKATAAGGDPGQASKGPVSSESVGGVSRSYDTSAGLNLDAGPWNLTTYGTRFLFMARNAAKGPIQIGVDPSRGALAPFWGPPTMPNGYW